MIDDILKLSGALYLTAIAWWWSILSLPVSWIYSKKLKAEMLDIDKIN